MSCEESERMGTQAEPPVAFDPLSTDAFQGPLADPTIARHLVAGNRKNNGANPQDINDTLTTAANDRQG
eukprot:12762044-Alexandrium_andersonii.AAC.1